MENSRTSTKNQAHPFKIQLTKPMPHFLSVVAPVVVVVVMVVVVVSCSGGCGGCGGGCGGCGGCGCGCGGCGADVTITATFSPYHCAGSAPAAPPRNPQSQNHGHLSCTTAGKEHDLHNRGIDHQKNTATAESLHGLPNRQDHGNRPLHHDRDVDDQR